MQLNSPCRVSWKIFNFSSKRLEILASPVCGPDVVFQGANQKHLVLNHGSSELMKGFIFVKNLKESVYLPILALKDTSGNSIVYLSNENPELKISP